MKNYSLTELGWDDGFENEFTAYRESGFEPARIIVEHKERYVVSAGSGEIPAEVTGKFIFNASIPSDYPKTGDWVAVTILSGENRAIIHGLVPRRTYFSRKAAGNRMQEQVLASNIDVIFIVQGLDNNYNKMRLLRYVVSLKESKIEPVVILNKTDINPGSEKIYDETCGLLKPVNVIKISAKTGEGMDILRPMMRKGRTHAFVGSSGAGKSTIINSIAGEAIAKTGEVREDDSRGRHVTVARQLYVLGSHGVLIDTPGIRELQLWADDEALSPGFEIIDEYAAKCRYADCAHGQEPGCAVRQAAEAGLILPEIMASYRKLRREMEFSVSKMDKSAALKRKSKEKKLSRAIKNYFNTKG